MSKLTINIPTCRKNNYNDMVGEYIKKRIEIENSQAEYILRKYIDNPIKGEITKYKLQQRGIKNVAFGPMHEFIGIVQRENLITPDGYKIPIVNGNIIFEKKTKI